MILPTCRRRFIPAASKTKSHHCSHGRRDARNSLAALSSLYLREKAVEEEFPELAFATALAGREAYDGFAWR
jgi:hypothetical protein